MHWWKSDASFHLYSSLLCNMLILKDGRLLILQHATKNKPLYLWIKSREKQDHADQFYYRQIICLYSTKYWGEKEKERKGKKKKSLSSQEVVKWNFLFQVWTEISLLSLKDKKYIYKGKQVHLITGRVLSIIVFMQSTHHVMKRDVTLWWKE